MWSDFLQRALHGTRREEKRERRETAVREGAELLDSGRQALQEFRGSSKRERDFERRTSRERELGVQG